MASRSMALKRYFIEALQEYIRRCAVGTDPPWMVRFGPLSDENHRILDMIEEEFGTISSEDTT